MSEELEIKVRADTGEAVTNLKKTETAVDGVTKATKVLDQTQGKAGDAIRKQTEGLNKLRGAFMEVWAALGIGKMVGDALAAVIDKVSASMARHDAKMQQAAVDSIKFAQAMRLAEKGLIGLGGTQEQFLARYDAYVAKMSPATKEIEKQAKALERLKFETEQVQKAIDAAAAGKSFTFISPDDIAKQEESLRNMGLRLDEILGKAFASGGAEERQRWADANKEAVETAIAAYARFGLEAPANVKAAYEAMTGSSAVWMKQLAEENAAAEEVFQAKLRRWAAEDAAANRTSKAPEEFRQIQQEAFGAAVAMGELGTNLDRVAEAVVKTGGQMVVGAPIWIQITQATNEATDALLRYAEASRALREEQVQSLEATRGWTDYVIALKEGYESGTTSLYNYVTALNAFKTQLEQMFASVTGPARESLDSMIALIEKLVSTAGAEGPTSRGGGFAGQFQRDADRAARGGG